MTSHTDYDPTPMHAHACGDCGEQWSVGCTAGECFPWVSEVVGQNYVQDLCPKCRPVEPHSVLTVRACADRLREVARDLQPDVPTGPAHALTLREAADGLEQHFRVKRRSDVEA